MNGREARRVDAYKETFARRLTAARKGRRVSRRTLSELCGLHPDAVRRYERQEAVPMLPAAAAIADYLNVSLDWMIGRTDVPRCPPADDVPPYQRF